MQESTPQRGNRLSLLIISFSPIVSDARVLRQVRLFSRDYDVTTLGFGARPPGVADHLEIPAGVRTDRYNPVFSRLHLHRLMYGRVAAVRWARQALRGKTFDIVLADEYETVPLALPIARLGVHADLHEYSPRMHEESPVWRRRVGTYISTITRRYVTRADSWTTVSRGLAREYERVFGITARVAYNAGPRVEATVGSTGNPIRLVHSGAALESRGLEVMMDAVALAGKRFSFDLYLMPNQPAYLNVLKAKAAQSDGQITIHDPVPYAQLSATLQNYDAGIYTLPPVNFNHLWAMPNKIFDFVQARLALVVGPSPEIAEFVRSHNVGSVAEGFDAEDLASALRSLTIEQIDQMKRASDVLAETANSAVEDEAWADAISALAGRARRSI